MSEEPQYTPMQVAEALQVDPAQVSFLGTGSFGETWRYLDGASTETAYKIFYRDGYQAELLEREIGGLQRVDHPGVVKIISHGEITIAANARPFIEFEFIEGEDLEHWIARQVPADWGNLRLLLQNLLEAVEAIHDAGVVHRDIKPANIALRRGRIETPVVLDLGLAKPLDANPLTIYPGHVGSPMYMAPEQLRAERAGPFADLWAVGVVVAEVALGHHPFYYNKPELSIDGALVLQKSGACLPDQLPPDISKVVYKLLSYKAYRRGAATSALKLLKN